MYNEKKELGDIFKEEILHHFIKLIKFIGKASAVTILIVLFIISSLVAHLRLLRNLESFKQILKDIKEDFIGNFDD